MKSRSFYRILGLLSLAAAVILMFVCIGMELDDSDDYPENSGGISLCINEALYSNLGEIRDEDGDNSDWIELYNYGSDRIDLEGFSLADHIGSRGRWYFPKSYIDAGEYLIVWASGKNRAVEGAELHTDFMLSSSDTLTLYDAAGSSVDELYFDGNMEAGVSVGRLKKHPSQLALLSANTPGKANNAKEISLVTRIDTALGTPRFSADSGIYDHEFELTLKAGEGEEIVYTLDGSDPTADSYVYSKPILIKDRSDEPNTIGNIKTTPNYAMNYSWENSAAYKGLVVKARIMKDGVLSDKIITKSYFVNPETSFNIISLSVDPEKMFDERKGIYVPGETYYIWKKYNKMSTNTAFPPGNYNEEGSIKAYVEIFTNTGKRLVATAVDAELTGAASRKYAAKGIKVTGDEPGSILEKDFFKLLPVSEEADDRGLESVTFRAGGTDFNRSMCADALAQSLVTDNLKVNTLAAEEAVLFINGEYWGIHNIRETLDPEYFDRHYGIDDKNLTLIKLNTSHDPHLPEITSGTPGDLQDYLELVDFAKTHDLSKRDNYRYVCDRIDIDSYIDYYIAEIYFGNNDWPGNNYRIWRADQRGCEFGDNKWRPVLFDLDEAFRYEAFNSVEYVLTEDYDKSKLDDDHSRGFDDNREIIDALMNNPEFEEMFFDRFEECLDTVFSEENVLAAIDRYERLYAPEMEDQFARWHTKDGWLTSVKLLLGKGYSEKGKYSVESWNKTIESFRTFAKERPDNIRRYIAQYKDN